MNDNRLSPVVIPTLLIHVGIVGLFSSMPLLTLNGVLIRNAGFIGMTISVLLFIAGYISLQILQRNPNYQNDVNLAHQTTNFLVFPLSNVIYIFLVITDFPFCLTVISILAIFAAQLYFRKVIASSATSYSLLLRLHEPWQLKYYFYAFATITNVISLSIVVYIYMA